MNCFSFIVLNVHTGMCLLKISEMMNILAVAVKIAV